MLCTELPANAAGAADDHGHLELATRGVVQHAAVVGDLVECQEQEAHVHALDNGAQAGHGCTHTHAHEAIFCCCGRDALADGAPSTHVPQMGVSRTRMSPYFLYRPSVHLYEPP